MLSQAFKSVLLLSIVGGLLSLILFALKPVTKRVFGSSWQYYIWLSVLIVMILPVTIKLPAQIATAPTLPTQITQESGAQPIQQSGNIPDTVTTPILPVQRTIADSLNRMTVGVYDLLIYIWLSGMLIFFMGGLISYWFFLRTVRKNSVPIPCSELSDVLLEKGMKNKIRVRGTACIDAPLMVGVFRPTLLLPDVAMSENDLRYILLHELTHLRRRDLWYKWFAVFVNAVHWFNPFIYFVVRQINEECEISCDLAVTGSMTEQEKSGYMNTILTLLSKSKSKMQMLTTARQATKTKLRRGLL